MQNYNGSYGTFLGASCSKNIFGSEENWVHHFKFVSEVVKVRHDASWISEVLSDVAIFLRNQGLMRTAEDAQDLIATLECEIVESKLRHREPSDCASAEITKKS